LNIGGYIFNLYSGSLTNETRKHIEIINNKG